MFGIFLYFFVTVIIGTMIRLICVNNRLRSRVEISLPAVLLILGMLYGVLALQFTILSDIGSLAAGLVEREAQNFIIPAFVMRLVFSFDWLSFLKSMTQIFVLGIFVFFLSSILVGHFIAQLMHTNIPIFTALVIGALMSTTDIDEVLNHYRQLKSVRVILTGEVLATTTLSCILYDIQRQGIIPKDLLQIPGWLLLVGSWVLAYFFGYVFVKLLRRDCFDINCYLILSFVTAFFLYLYAQFYANFPIIPLVIFASMISPGTNHVEAELATPIRVLWDALDIGLKMNLAFDAGVRFTRILAGMDDAVIVLAKTVLVYLFYYSLRFVLLLYVYPVLSITGFRINLSQVIILCLSGMEYTVALTYVSDFGTGSEAYIFTIGTVLLCQIVNVMVLRPVIALLGLLIPPRSLEMDDIIRRLAIEKEKAKNTLRQNDLYADVHWNLVEQITTFQAVSDYQAMLVSDFDGDVAVPDSNIRQELEQLREEAQLMILKAQKMSYERQRAQGLLRTESYHILRAEVDAAFFQNVPVLNVSYLRPYWTQRAFEKFLQKCFSSRSQVRKVSLYDEWTGIWYHSIKSVWWEIFIHISVIVFSICFIYDLVYNLEILADKWLIVSFHVVLVGIQFLFEVVAACGRQLYIFWHTLDLATFACGASCLILMHLTDDRSTVLEILYGLQLLRVIRLITVCKVLKRIFPSIYIFINSMVGNRLMLGYDMAKGFILGQQEALKLLPLIIANQKIREEMQQRLEDDKIAVFQEIGELENEWPYFTTQIKAQESAHYILHRMALRVQKFHNDGLLDEEETASLLYAMNETKYKVTRDIKASKPMSPLDMVGQMYWLEGERAACEIILANAELVNFKQGEAIFNKFDECTGIFFINFGQVQSHYVPDRETSERLRDYGEFPNIDHPCSLDFERSQSRIKCQGTTFGEFGVLTGRPFATTLICQTPVLVCRIPLDALQPLLPRLRLKMWKLVAMRVAALLLYQDNFFGTMPMEKIKRVLTKSLFVDLTGCKKFHLNDLIQVLILVDGKTVDNNDQQLIAPMCVSNEVKWIAVPGAEEPIRLLVVPVLEEEDLSMQVRNGEGYVTLARDAADGVTRHRQSVVSAVSIWSKRITQRPTRSTYG